MFLPIAFYNNEFLKLSDIQIHSTDLGIQRGYSVFDFFKLKNFNNPWIDWYMERLVFSTKSTGLNIQLSTERIKELSREVLERNNAVDGFIKIIISAGSSQDGYHPTSHPSILIMALPYFEMNPDYYKNGAHLILAEYQRDIPEIKTTNYLKSVMLADTMKRAGAVDVLYHNSTTITESSRCNFYIRIDDRVKTNGASILKGITRRRILSLDNLEFQITESPILLSELAIASEAFISSSTKGVMPIISIDRTTIGDGSVGPFTQQLMHRVNSF